MDPLKLEQLGLTNGESRVYLALLKLRHSTVGPIFRESGVANSKIYDVLNRLAEKGLVSFTIKENVKHFQALPPKRLRDYLEKKETEINESKKVLNSLLPQLEGLSEKNTEENVQIFKGKWGILTAYEIILDSMKKDEEIKYFFSDKMEDSKALEDFYIAYPHFRAKIEQYYKEKNIIWKGIGPKEGAKDPKWSFMKVKTTNFPVPGNFDLTSNYVFIISWENIPTGILIKSREIAKNLQEYFDLIWNAKTEK
jgi:HTH-type transcriptional regulator, sugar sensing transcriptional regulator